MRFDPDGVHRDAPRVDFNLHSSAALGGYPAMSVIRAGPTT